jgi:ABC-type Fe3+/spermidine/putrescine transport system ATPase subunit
MASIRTAGLTKDFGDLGAVSEIDLDLPEGGVAGFVGPNGAGKSTTIRMLLGLIQPTSGDGEVLGHPIADPPGYLHRVGALIEAPAFYPTLTGEENLRMFARLGGHDLAREADSGRGVIAGLVPGPASPSRITALKFPCPRDQAPWSFVLQDGQQPAPVTGSIAFHQARDTVTEKGGPGDKGPR